MSFAWNKCTHSFTLKLILVRSSRQILRCTTNPTRFCLSAPSSNHAYSGWGGLGPGGFGSGGCSPQGNGPCNGSSGSIPLQALIEQAQVSLIEVVGWLREETWWIPMWFSWWFTWFRSWLEKPLLQLRPTPAGSPEPSEQSQADPEATEGCQMLVLMHFWINRC